jgi:hypothetical protein
MINGFQRWFGLIGFGLFVLLGLGLFRWTPPGLLRVWLPLLGEVDWPVTAVTESARISPGRTTWLFFVSSRLGDGGSVQQYFHWYPDGETAVANYNQNKTGNPDKFPGDPSQYFVPMQPSTKIDQTLLCIESNSRWLLCEYRAQAGNWTVHVDFNMQNSAHLSLQHIEDLANQLGQKISKTLP